MITMCLVIFRFNLWDNITEVFVPVIIQQQERRNLQETKILIELFETCKIHAGIVYYRNI